MSSVRVGARRWIRLRAGVAEGGQQDVEVGRVGVAIAIVAEGSLAFLGLSVEKGPTWGKIILTASQSSRDLENAPYMAFFPIGVLFLTVLALNFAGDRLRSYFDVRELSL